MDPLTSEEVKHYQQICPGVQENQIGARLKDAVERIVVNEAAIAVVQANEMVQLTFEITTGSGTIQLVTVPFGIEVLDMIIQARGNSTNGTMKLNDGTNDITDAVVCAVDTTITRAGTIDDSKASIAAGADLGIICAGDTVANTKGLITIVARRT